MTLTCRIDLARRQISLLEKERDLLDRDQTVSTLQEEVSMPSSEFVLCALQSQLTCRSGSFQHLLNCTSIDTCACSLTWSENCVAC